MLPADFKDAIVVVALEIFMLEFINRVILISQIHINEQLKNIK